MPDKYANFSQLALHEGRDAYRIHARLCDSSIAVLAPHGGKIEPGTSQICLAIAGDHMTHYLFEGCKPTSNADLHITSNRFDEPHALLAARSAAFVVTVHGQSGSECFVNVGGRHEALGQSIMNVLNETGYHAHRHSNPNLQGTDSRNICNRGQAGRGVQLEISRGLRDRLCANDRELQEFAAIVREALRQHAHS